MRLLPDSAGRDGGDAAEPDRVPRAAARVPRRGAGGAGARRQRPRGARRARGAARSTRRSCAPARTRRWRRCGAPARRCARRVHERLVDFALPRLPGRAPGARATGCRPRLAEADRRARRGRRDDARPRRRRARGAGGVRPERLRAVFGGGVPGAPARAPGEPRRSSRTRLRRSDELQGGDPLQAHSWLQGAGRVRPGASRLDARADATPPRSTARRRRSSRSRSCRSSRASAGSACPARRRRAGKVSLVAHLPRPFQVSAPLSGLVIDEWIEVVPAREVTTGVAFNYDAPGARRAAGDPARGRRRPGARAGRSRRSRRPCWRRSSWPSCAPSTRRRSAATCCCSARCPRST